MTPSVPIRLAGIAILATSAAAAEPAHDFVASPGLECFQPARAWHRVERAVAVPDRMELTTSGSGPILVNGLTKDISIPYLFTRESFGDVRVDLEFMIPQGSNAGIYLMGRYEIQILDSFGHRYRDATTAHESGVFRYSARPNIGEATVDYIAFEALLSKTDGRWRILMEYQKGKATQQDWDALSHGVAPDQTP